MKKMGVLLLVAILSCIILKVGGFLTLSWLLIFSPLIVIGISLYFIFIGGCAVMVGLVAFFSSMKHMMLNQPLSGGQSDLLKQMMQTQININKTGIN